ncbi:MAG: DNA-binding transcriptional LysR family regulator [Flavobacteriales bacterium]|jgi:DNA-binding transcriptional LysR family regulator
MQNINWDDIRYFLAVYRQGTVSGAAEALNVNHTTVSRRIAALEQKLNFKLFERKRNRYVITEHAETVLSYATNMELEALAFSRKLQGQDEQLDGKLRITLPDVVSYYLLNKALVKFARDYPDIQLEIINSDNPIDLNAQEADIAIRFTDNPPQFLVGKCIATIDYAIYASSKLIDSTPNLDTRNISALSWIDQVDRPLWLERNYPNMKRGCKFNSLISMVSSLRNGAGIAQIPCFIGERDPLLKRIPSKYVEPGWGLWVLHHVDLKQSSKVKVAYRFLSDALSEEMKKHEFNAQEE